MAKNEPKAESNLVEFGSYSQEAAEREQNQIDAGGSTFKKLKEGRNKLRILPPPKGKDSPFEVVYNHFVRIEGEDRAIIVRCPRMMSGGKKYCPICKRVETLANSPNPLDRSDSGQLKAKQAAIANVIDREDPESGSMPISFSANVYKDINALRNDPDDPVDFTHPIEGYDLYIDRKGTGKKDTRYTVRLGKQRPLAEEVEDMNDLILGQADTSKFASLPTDEELLKLANGEKPDYENKRLEAGDEPRRSRSRRPRDENVVDAELVEDDDFPA